MHVPSWFSWGRVGGKKLKLSGDVFASCLVQRLRQLVLDSLGSSLAGTFLAFSLSYSFSFFFFVCQYWRVVYLSTVTRRFGWVTEPRKASSLLLQIGALAPQLNLHVDHMWSTIIPFSYSSSRFTSGWRLAGGGSPAASPRMLPAAVCLHASLPPPSRSGG
jgi:hypothetical protein